MARLEHLRRNILDMTEEERIRFITEYRERRFKEITAVVVKVSGKRASKKGETGSKDKKIAVTPEQLRQLKALGVI